MKNISKKIRLRHLFAFAIIAGMMTLNVSAATKEITLDAERTTQVVVNEDTVLNLNGKNLTVGSGHAIVVNEGATLTIKGTGVVTANGSSSAAIFNNGGTVNVNGGTYISKSWYAIKNVGKMTINDGVVGGTLQKQNSSLIDNGFASSSEAGYPTKDTGKVLLIINGGKFTHLNTTSTIKGDDWSKTIINGGAFESKQGFLIQASGTIEVNGGTFTGYSSVAVLYGFNDAADPGILTINGGSFSAKYIASAYNDGKLTITGGDFSSVTDGAINPSKYCNGKMCAYTATITGGTFATDVTKYLADGYALNTNTEEQYVVAKKEVKVETPTIDTSKETVEVEEVTIGVKEDEAVDETLKASLAADEKLAEKVKNINTVVEVTVENQEEKVVPEKAAETITKAVKEAKTEEKSEMKVASFFDITLNVKNNATGEKVGVLTLLSKKLTFNVALPKDITKVADGYTRTYYIVRYHDGKAEILDTKLSGNVLTFETDKFSTYAIAYTDTAVKADTEVDTKTDTETKTDTKTETKTDTETKTETVVNPSTGDNIILYVAAGIIALVGIGYTVLNISKRKNN